MTRPIRLAVIGDIHLDFDARDRAYFDASDYDLLLFTGDLSDTFHPRRSLQVAERLARLRKPALLIPGNHDIANLGQLLAEILEARWLAQLAGLGHLRYQRRLERALDPVDMGGYSAHSFQILGQNLGVICARPYAMGGSRLNYAPLLRRGYGVRSHEDSVALLCQKVDALPVERIIFLAHNGPYGLGASPADIWGCDFDPSQGDFGDRDLAETIAYACQCGKRVLAVVAGHMHLQTHLGPKPFWRRHAEPGPERPWQVVKDSILYLNAARVPRHLVQDGQPVAQHICLTIQDSQVEANEIYVPR
jgi:uncharacterized protein (TIGR04168 family)